MTETPEASPQDVERSALRKLWLVLALLCLLVSVNVMVRTQGGGGLDIGIDAVFSLDFTDQVPEALAGFWGVVFLSVLIMASSGVLIAHARRTLGSPAERYPFRAFEVPVRSSTGTVAQVLAFLLLSCAPVYVLCHGWVTLYGHGVICFEPSDTPATWSPRERTPFQLFIPAPAGGKARLGSTETVKIDKENVPPCSPGRMIDYLFPLTTYFFAVLSLAALLVWGGSLFALVWRRKAA